MEHLDSLYAFLELAGSFAFAISGATAARQRNLDLFGICVVAFLVACGGGIIRDLCIGAIPPAGLSTWYYLAAAVLATAMVAGFYPLVRKLNQPVLLFDAIGLSLFAVTGAEKTLDFGHNDQMAVLLGITTAVGGGVLRDVLLNRVPVILEREIYASAALLAALVVVLGQHQSWLTRDWVSIIALLICLIIRILALRYHWNMPGSVSNDGKRMEE